MGSDFSIGAIKFHEQLSAPVTIPPAASGCRGAVSKSKRKSGTDVGANAPDQ